jgi:magnesium transporter
MGHDIAVKNYPKDSAGRLAVASVPVVSDEATVASVRRLLEEKVSTYSTINYVYVLDLQRRLVGVVSLRQILQAAGQEIVQSLSPQPVVFVRPYTDAERAAHVALRANLKAIMALSACCHLM